jgi:5,10-methylenetetrahydromethanopterin reductase
MLKGAVPTVLEVMSTPRFGIVLSPAQLKSLHDFASAARVAEEEGLNDIWVPDDSPNPPYGETWAAAAAVVLNTSKVTVGTSAVNPYTRHPSMIASAILTLDEASRGRMILGVSTGGPTQLKYFGIPMEKPIAAVRDCISVCRQLFQGNVVSMDGKVFSVYRTKLSASKKRIPIYIAARSPQLIRLSGEVADGILVNIPADCTNYLKAIKENLKIGAERAGRDPNEISIIAILDYALSDSEEEALSNVRRQVLIRILWAPKYLVELLGFNPSIQDELRKDYYDGVERSGSLEEGLRAAAKKISDEMVDKVAVAGNIKTCTERSRKILQCGATGIAFYSRFETHVGRLNESTQKTCRKIIPSLRL